MIRTLRTWPVFALAVLVTLGLAGLNGGMVALMQLRPGFMGMAHFTEHHHRIHDVTFSLLFVPAIVGMLAQLRRPAANVAGMAMALVPWAGLLLAVVLSRALAQGTDVRGLANLAWVAPAVSTLVAAVLHPTWRGFFRSFRTSRISWVMVALVAVAAVPLLALSATNIGLQASIRDDHADLGHYGFMAAVGFTVVGVGLLASLRPDGWRLTAWVAGLLPALLGIASFMYPDVSSTVGPVWGTASIAWGAAFVALAERTYRAEPVPTAVPAVAARVGAPGTPRWVTFSGAVFLALAVLAVGMFLTGTSVGGIAGHRPPAGGHH